MKIRRCLAFLCDYYIVSFISFMITFVIALCGGVLGYNKFPPTLNFIVYVVNCVTIIILMFKDLVFKNKSIGKKIMGIEVRTIDNQIPKIRILILRNLLYIIWPLELIVLLTFNRRIGDIIFNVNVVKL